MVKVFNTAGAMVRPAGRRSGARVQTTLLGLAIALILALVTALVGPYFVDWNQYRSHFEAEASRIVGLNVRVAGDIDARLLPFPSVKLAGVEIGPTGQASRLRARSLDIEFGLGPLMRGELRAVEMRLAAPQVSLGLNSLGQIDWPAMALATETLSIDRLKIDDGRMVLTDAASDTRLVVEKLSFTGEVKSLTGPFRGSGSFSAAGTHYAYRVSAAASPTTVSRSVRARRSERPLNAELRALSRLNALRRVRRCREIVSPGWRRAGERPWSRRSRGD